MSTKGKEAFVTLATSDDYALGALVLAHSLRESGTSRQLAIMVPPSGISEPMTTLLQATFDHVERVDLLDSEDQANLALLARPELGVTFTKLHCWRMTQYEKAVFMDADTLVVKNIDDLFDREELSAAPDPGWPDCFNSGVFVFRPSEDTYRKLLDFAAQQGSFDGGDQGLLNLYFHDWATKDIGRHLPFTYNCVSQSFYSYLPAFTRFRSHIRVVHFIGAAKPWQHNVLANLSSGGQLPQDCAPGGSSEFLQRWWSVLFRCVLPHLPKDMEGLAGSFARLELPSKETTLLKMALESERDRQYAWERNEIDYTGQDRFENILSKINSALSSEEQRK